MTKKEIEAFKNRIKNYNFHKEQIIKLYEEENKLWYELSFVKGASFGERVPTTNPEVKNDKVLKYYEDIDKIRIKREEHCAEISKLDTMLEEMSDEGRTIIKHIYLKGNSYEKTAEYFFTSKSSIAHRINKALLEVKYI